MLNPVLHCADQISAHEHLSLSPQQLSGSASSVKIQGYKVRWRQEGCQWILWKDREQTQTEISIGPGQCDMIIQAVIQPGSSPPGHITIPPVERIGQLSTPVAIEGSQLRHKSTSKHTRRHVGWPESIWWKSSNRLQNGCVLLPPEISRRLPFI